jgi:hypothetical protein
MITEEKVTIDRSPKSEFESSESFPWEIHQHTQRDVHQAVVAFSRLLDAIESRLPPKSTHILLGSNDGIELPYPNWVIESLARKDSFAQEFLSALPIRYINCHYIAPGIRIQNITEFIAQPFENLGGSYGDRDVTPPLLLFRGDGENTTPWSLRWLLDGRKDIPAGLYLEAVHAFISDDPGNDSRLLLPFEVGRNGYARSSNGVLLNDCGIDRMYDKLYRDHQPTGILPWGSHSSYIHKVLVNWAERVESGDWEVNGDGVANGIEKFKDADTPDHWMKYQTS